MRNARVVIYTTATCGYCHAAKHLLSMRNVAYEEVDVAGRRDLRLWLAEASQQRTVPQIFINGTSLGGYRELTRADESGQLDELMRAEPGAGDPDLPR